MLFGSKVARNVDISPNPLAISFKTCYNQSMDKNTNITTTPNTRPVASTHCKLCNEAIQSVSRQDRKGICFVCEMLDGSSINEYANWGDFHEPTLGETIGDLN